MLIVFIDSEILLHKDFIPQAQTVNQQFYIEVLGQMTDNVRRKHPDRAGFCIITSQLIVLRLFSSF
jgi:hypothetical protein